MNLVKVRLGDWDVRTNPDCDENGSCNNPYVEILIQNIIIHGDYNLSNRSHSDIALIKLQTNIQFTQFIIPICLPFDENVRHMNMTDHQAEIAGFGFKDNNTMNFRKMKHYVSVSPQRHCEEIYARYNNTINGKQVWI